MATIVGLGAAEAWDRYTSGDVNFTDGDGDTLRRPFASNSTRVTSHVQKDRQISGRPPRDHTGIDLAVSQGTTAYAIADGKVKYAGPYGTCGGTITIDHEQVISARDKTYTIIQTTYCHMSEISVAKDETVVAGQPIGKTGGKPGTDGAGRSDGPHLHLQIKCAGVSLTDKGPYGVYLSIVAPEEFEEDREAREAAAIDCSVEANKDDPRCIIQDL